MNSKFVSNVNKVIGSRAEEIEQKVYKHQEILGRIEKNLDDEKIKTAQEAMQELKKAFGYHLTDNEYRDIQKQISYDI